MGRQDDQSVHSGRIYVVCNWSRISIEEVAYGSDLTGHGQTKILRPEQKSVTLMRDFERSSKNLVICS